MNPLYQVVIQSVNSSNPANSINVKAYIPESFMYDTSASYEAPFSQGITGNRLVDMGMRIGMGAQIRNQAMSAQVWTGNTETELGLELEFHAEKDPYTEVMLPIKQLTKLATAKEGEVLGLIESPGPRIDGVIWEQLKSSTNAAAGYVANNVLGGEASVGTLTDPSQTFTNGNNDPNRVDPNASSNIFRASSLKSYIQDQISIQVGGFAFFDSVVITHVQKTYQTTPEATTGLPFYARVNIRFKPLFMILQHDLDNIFQGASATGAAPVQQAPSAVTTGGAQTFPVEPPSTLADIIATPPFNPT